MNTAAVNDTEFSKKEAEVIARQFNIAYGHALMYGVNHQMAIDSSKPFFAILIKSLVNYPLITVSFERDSVYIEGVCVDKIVNAKKLVAHFRKIGVDSFSFTNGITAAQLSSFVEVTVNAVKYPNADAIKRELQLRSANTVRINYVVFRKMTADEEVIHKEALASLVNTSALEQGMADPPGSATRTGTFSLKAIMANPKAAAGALFRPKQDGTLADPKAIVDSMSKLGDQIRQAGGAIASGNLMEAVLVLREECLQRMVDFKTAGAADGDIDAAVSEVEKLTHETIVSLLRDEYREGEISVKRLAQILRRMVPDRRELRKLLPKIKDGLLAEGMPLAKYIELVNELRGELESDEVVGALSTATRDMGVTAEEVIEEIKKHPADTARLIILAAELRRTEGGNTAALEQSLTDFIERASRHFALDSPEAGHPESGKNLGTILQKMESNLLDNLKRQGVEQSVLTALGARLTERLPFLVDIAKTEWLTKIISAHPDFDIAMLAKVIASTVQQEFDIDQHRDTLMTLFKKKGLTPEQIQEVLAQATSRVVHASQQFELPRGVLSSSVVMYFLERECKLCLRYHNPFSILIVSILRRNDTGGGERALTAEERPRFINSLILRLKQTMRDIDMIGVPASTSESIVFVLLPMTDETHTYGLVERLRLELGERPFEVEGLAVPLTLAVSITGFDYTTMPDKQAFLKAAMAHHRAAEKIRLSGITE
jgi:hypothetical protein